MAYISKIKVPGVESTVYLIKDSEGRLMIAPEYDSSTSYSAGDYYVKDGKFYVVRTTESGTTGIETTVSAELTQHSAELKSIKQSIAGAMHYIGVTSTLIYDGDEEHTTLEPTTTGSLTKTSGFVAGDVVLAPASDKTAEKYYEYVWNGNMWNEFGSTKAIGKMAYANEAKGINTIEYEVPVYTGGTISVNEYRGDDESAVYIKPTSVVGSVEVGTTTSASSVTKKNKYLSTKLIKISGDSGTAMTGFSNTYRKLGTTSIYGVDETGSAVTEVSSTNKRLATTKIYGVQSEGVEVSKVERGATNIRVGDTALTTVANGLLGEARDAMGYNPLVDATIDDDECLSWFESPLDTTQIRGAAYQTVDVPDIKITAVTGIAMVASDSVTVATGALVNKDDAGGDMVSIGVTSSTESFAKKGVTGTTVATGGLVNSNYNVNHDNKWDKDSIVCDLYGYWDLFQKFSFDDASHAMVATGQLSDTGTGGDNIADAIEVTQVNGLVTGLSVKNKDNVLQKVGSGVTGATGLLTGLKSSVREFQVPVVKNGNETYSVDTEINVRPNPEPESKYLTMTIPEGSSTTQISINKNGTPVGTNIQYRVNYGKWTNWDFTSPQAISANANDVIQWKGNNPKGLSKDYENYIYFDIPNEVYLSGNVMSLIDGVGDIKVIPCNFCFYNLFYNAQIKYVSKDFLPATTLANYCYNNMFQGCTSLLNAPALPATVLAEYCYCDMFQGCTSLATAPALHATTLVEGCYSYMFEECSSLVKAPELPSTTLSDNCYYKMFSGCSSLVTAPALHATVLAGSCYGYMFNGCTSLTTAPELPATTLAEYCYEGMFSGCTSLVNAPALNATTLVDSCYYYMFQGCSKLQHVTCLATDKSATDCTSSWLEGVASTGTFNKAAGVTWTTGVNGIPEGWTVIEPEIKYLTMTIPEGSTATISIKKQGTHVGTNFQYKFKDDAEWTDWNFETSQPISAKANDVIQWRGDNPNGLSKYPDNDYVYFEIPNEVHLSGNVMSLIDGVGDTKVIPCNFCFNGLFSNANIKTVTKDFLPATNLSEGCYMGMFMGCTSLTAAPELPATTLAGGCYLGMFFGCTSLTTAPALNATTLADSCYGMMFGVCTSLTTSPELPATTLAGSCYRQMFSGCSNLNKVTCLATDKSATDCTTNWLSGVAPTGTFKKAAGVEWSRDGNGIPNGWTVIEQS